jgi:hypothetical protein
LAKTIARAATGRRHGSTAARQAWVLLLVIETSQGVIVMNTHTETANTIFQVLTIAVMGLFSVVAVLNVAAQIV